ncbi:MAG TPA: 2-iminoacetate synthase ThiH [Ruminiclostridium sp.]|nr:2-iminoacetate synthase ThiH [Ruminiclostridium sp.]
MDFYDYIEPYRSFDIGGFLSNVTDMDVRRIISKGDLTPLDFLSLLSPAASNHLEAMARRANSITVRQFGKVIFMFAPLYLANHCVNRCAYCGFNAGNKIKRAALTPNQVEKEAQSIAATGIRDILFLTGESREISPPEYMAECTAILKKYFTNVALEVYPLETDEYSMLNKAGVDSFTMFQECYNEERYSQVHLGGPKRNYRFRLDAPERACRAGFRNINLGALLGLYEYASEAFFTGLHVYYLQHKYDSCDFAVSLPRLCPHTGEFEPYSTITDRDIVQDILALRLFLPRAGITVSTREKPEFRDNLIGLGVTKMSAGSSTEVGGYANHTTSDQFSISDTRSVDEVVNAIRKRGYLPVFKDWQTLAEGDAI